ncbi:hypothetical protein FIU97_12610 [Roseivivax sp. THAF40]|uniref:DUF2924 domain-containing protein n=1 Tax=Roseivivax sp. THAF40 TaxID=2587858 RepID=UPI0012690714|nr:DUF2924 domain-containing protein [Roseivivax sp. THAF40]QFT47416.1 hypothetical protein FIU97_12610 [Roseivivax sp. THAF40]
MIRIADLETMDRAALVAAWSDTFGEPAPKSLSRAFLRRFIATEIQSRRRGGVTKKTRAALTKSEDRSDLSRSPVLEPGGRLIRDWNGVTHVVEVNGNGYRWRGTTWRSLSAIAREITGTNWSGPRFFGLNGKSGS